MSSATTIQKSVSIHVTRDEFHLLSTLMSPLYFDESKGASVWVSSEPDGSRTWTVRDNEGAVAMVNTTGARVDLRHFDDGDTSWAYPVSEITLIGIGKFLMISDFDGHGHGFDLDADLESESDNESRGSSDGTVVLTLSDTRISFRAADMEVSTPQNHKATTPPMRPTVNDRVSFDVDPTKLWCILSQARTWPASGECHGMNTPMICRIDPATDQMVISVDWSPAGNGVSTYSIPIEWRMRHQQIAPTEFVVPHATLLNVLRDPHNARQLKSLTFQIGDKDSSHVVVWGPNWSYYVPAIPDVAMWGHDLDEVLGDTAWTWKHAAMVKVWPGDLDNAVDLTPLPDDPSHAPYRYRATYEVCSDVVPTLDLYNEVNLINERTAGYRLVIDGSRIVALTDYTNDNYRELEKHIAAFASNVSSLTPLLHALGAPTTTK